LPLRSEAPPDGVFARGALAPGGVIDGPSPFVLSRSRLHLTGGQDWRTGSKGYPKLREVGARPAASPRQRDRK